MSDDGVRSLIDGSPLFLQLARERLPLAQGLLGDHALSAEPLLVLWARAHQITRIRTPSDSMRASSTVHSPGSTSSRRFSTLRALPAAGYPALSVAG